MNFALQLFLVVSSPAGVVHLVTLELLRMRKFFTHDSFTKLSEPPLSSSALIVTGLGFPKLVLIRMRTTGLSSLVLAFLAGLFDWPQAN